ncbi:nonribosomal peptide synthetase MxaA [Methylobacillus arboreus]|uniref:nonribosomal peptide synthetase MxaA n=1 Tax=Methylobacillus arboreus TaxID=755170 RepID=UPI001E3D9A81|nr:nonribosomal peptide synthetase MxaA [Methylobacillus arboreus]MCB5191513.1 nonribosomal peptide synthetase MxaA [Methylobacillus arboreus]
MSATAANAAEATLVALENPRVSTGIAIGDVLERKLVIEAKSPYELPASALPLKGERVDGIEVMDVSLQSEKAGDGHRYQVKLSYQVFAASDKPRVMRLPAATLNLAGGNTPVEVSIPAWHFWYSPLVAGNIHTARSNAQPQRKPALLDTGMEPLGLTLAVLLLGLGGLVYINADRRWLPWMGGSFAQAYRKLRRLPPQAGSNAQALGYLHQAFNRVYGRALFRRQLGEFLAQHPQYQSLAGEIDGFFQRSEALLFAHGNADSAALIKDLQQLCRRLRDCERKIA